MRTTDTDIEQALANADEKMRIDAGELELTAAQTVERALGITGSQA